MEHDKHDHAEHEEHEEREETGEPRVDQAVAGLDRLAELPPDEHVPVFERTHATLRQVLSELDSGPDDSGGR
jgi:hypothetical protein